MPLAVPMLGIEQKGHLTDCYLSFTKTDSHISKYKHTIIYSSTPNDSPPIPTQPQQWALHVEEPISTAPEDESGPSKFQFPRTNSTSSYIAV
jgi:hypothetical protein